MMNINPSLSIALKKKQSQLALQKLSGLLEAAPAFKPLELGELFFDFSKNFVDCETRDTLLNWAKATNLQENIEKLFSGALVNQSENRAALHMALRQGCSPDLQMAGNSLEKIIQCELSKIKVFSDNLRSKTFLGFSGKPIDTLVNLGVGGSHLGLALGLDALQQYSSHDIKINLVSSGDGYYFTKYLKTLNPETTLFIISSKSFTTPETLENAQLAQTWFLEKTQERQAWQKHFIGISASKTKMDAYGILPEYQFCLWDWVGGRFSIGSSIGLPLAISIGFENFQAFLNGMREADQHFLKAPLSENIPVILGLLSVWYIHFWEGAAHAILPYDERLQKLPAYLAQLEMESLGKQVRLDGLPVNAHTSPIIIGETGTQAQHSFMQLLHQGTRFITSDFIALAKNDAVNPRHHTLSLAHCFAQSRALALGFYPDDKIAENHQINPGNRPSNTILMDLLSPYALGTLIATYEHKVFVESVLWNINPFDQWGVECGKKNAKMLLAHIGKPSDQFDFSTNTLLSRVAKFS